MKNLARDRSGSALMVSMALMGILSLMMILLLERIIPSSQSSRGIENSTVALYHSSSMIEKAFATMNYRKPGLAAGSGTSGWSTGSGSYSIFQSGTIIPLPGKGNSEYDSDWNRINAGNPIQLRLTKDQFDILKTNWDMVLDLRMPKLGSEDTFAGKNEATQYYTDSGAVSVAMVSLSDAGTTFTAHYGTWCVGDLTTLKNGINASMINNPNPTKLGELCMKNLTSTGAARTLENQLGQINNSAFCTTSEGCTLKISLVVKRIQNKGGETVPYLEYRIRKSASLTTSNEKGCFLDYPPHSSCNIAMDMNPAVALPYTTVSSEGVASGFRRTNRRDLLQLTTSAEMDFAVFQ